MGCFMIPRHKRQAPGSLDSFSSKEECFFTTKSLPPFTLTATNSSSKKAKRKSAKNSKSDAGSGLLNHPPRPLSDLTISTSFLTNNTKAKEVPFIFSSALTGNAMESPSFRTLSDPTFSTFCYDCVPKNLNLDRGSSFGGRPLPLSLPGIDSHAIHEKPICPPLPPPQDSISSVSISSSSELRFMSGASSFVSTSQPSSFKSDQGGFGSWSVRRGKVLLEDGLPLPSPSMASKLLPGLESYGFCDLMHATQNFAPEYCMEKGDFGAVYRAWIKDLTSGACLKKEMAVVRLAANDNQTLKEWKSEVQMLVQLPDTNICLIKGYCGNEKLRTNGQKMLERILVFEQSPNGNLHDYLYGSRSKTLLDWSTRISIVLGAARGLLYLHDRAPLQVVYREFKASSVLLDKNYRPRLAGYGIAVTSSPTDKRSYFTAAMKLSQAHAKNNVWGFGIVLLELLTGKYSRDSAFLCDEKNFVQWGTPFLKEEVKMLLILDPRIKAKCPLNGVMKLSQLTLQCLRKKDIQKPSMSRIVEILKAIKENTCGRLEHNNFNSVIRRRTASEGGLSFPKSTSKVFGQNLGSCTDSTYYDMSTSKEDNL